MNGKGKGKGTEGEDSEKVDMDNIGICYLATRAIDEILCLCNVHRLDFFIVSLLVYFLFGNTKEVHALN